MNGARNASITLCQCKKKRVKLVALAEQQSKSDIEDRCITIARIPHVSGFEMGISGWLRWSTLLTERKRIETYSGHLNIGMNGEIVLAIFFYEASTKRFKY